MTDERFTADAVPNPNAICPFLLSADGGWRSATAIRDHRCTALVPPAPLAAEKQRRLCLTDGHRSCATFLAAAEARSAVHRDAALRRPVARTTPVVLDHGRLAVALPALASTPHFGQGALIGVLGLAFGAVLLARIALGGGAPGSAGAVATGTPAATATATAGAVASATPAVTTTPEPTPASTTSPVATPTLVPTEGEPTPSPSAEGTPATYKVKSGDTLSGIAQKFGTTVKVLAKLNDIKDPSKIHVGQVIKLP